MNNPIASVIVPAHNEEQGIVRLLEGLIGGDEPSFPLEIVVVSNGSTDRTVAVASSYSPRVRVLDLPQPSKRDALLQGDKVATVFPRLYVDADVEISLDSVERLVDVIVSGRALATAPERILPRDGVNSIVRWYYDVWERLPQVRSGLFGRGVIALSEQGNERVRALPSMMSDDLVMSEAFSDLERCVVKGAHVVVRPPKSTRDLVRRRIRVATGNSQVESAGLRGSSAKTSLRSLGALALAEPSLIPKLPIFIAITVVARLYSRSAVRGGDFDSWLRDESSRA